MRLCNDSSFNYQFHHCRELMLIQRESWDNSLCARRTRLTTGTRAMHHGIGNVTVISQVPREYLIGVHSFRLRAEIPQQSRSNSHNCATGSSHTLKLGNSLSCKTGSLNWRGKNAHLWATDKEMFKVLQLCWTMCSKSFYTLDRFLLYITRSR